jgi:1-deoxy-D-xylulose-5-phosphate reductoisomerase
VSERVTILGATGSIGRSATDVLLQHPDRFKVAAVVGGQNAAELAATATRLGADFAALADESRGPELKAALAGTGIACGAGASAVLEAVEREADTVIAAIAGVAGLGPTHAALKPGRRLALANKESLVCAGDALMREAARLGTTIVPLDSEHNALRQAIGSGHSDDIVTMTLTASGGPFRTWPAARIAAASPAEAAAHPTWSMGAKINIDSASLMNKGLELIEAHHLFGIDHGRLAVVVHPQSIVHGLITWRDGSVTAGLAPPDMRVPMANCLEQNERRIDLAARRLDLAAIGSLTFEAPDESRFPCLTLAKAALAAGGAMPTVLNGANEIAVAAFIGGRIGFSDIARIVEESCAVFARRSSNAPPASVAEALAVDDEARRVAGTFLSRKRATVMPAMAGGEI